MRTILTYIKIGARSLSLGRNGRNDASGDKSEVEKSTQFHACAKRFVCLTSSRNGEASLYPYASQTNGLISPLTITPFTIIRGV